MVDQQADQPEADSLPPVKELSRAQQRVLGVLVEKALTVPETYPLTLKAATAGCNQKSNRHPVTNYSEDVVLQTLDELRELGLAAVVHTETGRTERYRHYARRRFPVNEPQLAILTELLLRGKQQLGELRARASRMVPIESLGDLRTELDALIQLGYVRALGSLDRRGVEVTHTFSGGSEGPIASEFEGSEQLDMESHKTSERSTETGDMQQLRSLQQEHEQLRLELDELRTTLAAVRDDVAELRRSLGV